MPAIESGRYRGRGARLTYIRSRPVVYRDPLETASGKRSVFLDGVSRLECVLIVDGVSIVGKLAGDAIRFHDNRVRDRFAVVPLFRLGPASALINEHREKEGGKATDRFAAANFRIAARFSIFLLTGWEVECSGTIGYSYFRSAEA